MAPFRTPPWPSIGATIFGAFVAMALLMATVGGYGIYVLDKASGFVVGLYDRPLMAVNFDRAASLDFVEMDKELIRRDAAPDGERSAIDDKIERLARTFTDDIGVAAQRSVYRDEREVIAAIGSLVADWEELRRTGGRAVNGAAMDRLAAQIMDRFDALAERSMDNSFVERRRVVSAVDFFRHLGIAALGLAIALAIGTTFLLLRRIVSPLRHAAAVADRIAAGEFEAPIPRGGRGETGALLRSMTVMQENLRDLVEREQAQRRSAQNRLIDALESSREAVVLVDGEGRIVIANSQFGHFFPSLAALLENEPSYAAAAARLAALVADGSESEDDDQSANSDPLRSGREFRLFDGPWLRISRSQTREGGFFLLISDISDIKEREDRISEALRQAEAASDAKSTFLATMSHELRTPLNAVIGFSEILSAEMYGALGDQRYKEYVNSIELAGKHLLGIINKILDLTKHQAGTLEIAAEPIDLLAIIDGCVAILREQCERGGLTLVSQMPEALTVWGDRGKLRQMLTDLMSNAVKFTDPGGTVSVSAGQAADGSAWLEISDTGIGMSVEQIPVALTPFGQVDNRLARRYEGAGLGLPLVKAVIDLHHGELSIDSDPGKGAKFLVSLPSRPANASPAAAA